VAERFIAAVEESKTKNPPLTFFISFIADDVRKQAKESTERHANGKSLSILDGILLAVKDDVDCLPHPSTGTFSLLQILDVRPKIQFQVLIVGRCV
jgi:Asp-tRNA(Asn)/Glu-tRNA(Gln) amidotransferase A subunit family amidase